MHRVFISFHHANDEWAKKELVAMGERHKIFHNYSVGDYEIDPSLPNQAIRRIIRDDYLRDSSVTILLVGTQTWGSMHCDWELKSSMIDGTINKKSGILVIQLPSTDGDYFTAAHKSEKNVIYPATTGWVSVNSEEEYKRRYPYIPPRIIDNLLKPGVKISVTSWSKIADNPQALALLIENAFQARTTNDYCLDRRMRRRNHRPSDTILGNALASY